MKTYKLQKIINGGSYCSLKNRKLADISKVSFPHTLSKGAHFTFEFNVDDQEQYFYVCDTIIEKRDDNRQLIALIILLSRLNTHDARHISEFTLKLYLDPNYIEFLQEKKIFEGLFNEELIECFVECKFVECVSNYTNKEVLVMERYSSDLFEYSTYLNTTIAAGLSFTFIRDILNIIIKLFILQYNLLKSRLVYYDCKLQNVVRCGSSIKFIDLASVDTTDKSSHTMTPIITYYLHDLHTFINSSEQKMSEQVHIGCTLIMICQLLGINISPLLHSGTRSQAATNQVLGQAKQKLLDIINHFLSNSPYYLGFEQMCNNLFSERHTDRLSYKYYIYMFSLLQILHEINSEYVNKFIDPTNFYINHIEVR